MVTVIIVIFATMQILFEARKKFIVVMLKTRLRRDAFPYKRDLFYFVNKRRYAEKLHVFSNFSYVDVVLQANARDLDISAQTIC